MTVELIAEEEFFGLAVPFDGDFLRFNLGDAGALDLFANTERPAVNHGQGIGLGVKNGFDLEVRERPGRGLEGGWRLGRLAGSSERGLGLGRLGRHQDRGWGGCSWRWGRCVRYWRFAAVCW